MLSSTRLGGSSHLRVPISTTLRRLRRLANRAQPAPCIPSEPLILSIITNTLPRKGSKPCIRYKTLWLWAESELIILS